MRAHLTKFHGDPQRPSEVRPYDPQSFTKDDADLDMFGMVSLLFGMATLILKAKFLAWVCVITCLLAMANSRGRDADVKQLTTAVSLAAFGLFSAYFEPIPR